MEYDSLEEFKDRAGYVLDGIWYPRVTSIISIKAKPALLRYYGGMRSFKAADDAKEASAREGTLVHEAVEALARGEAAVTLCPPGGRRVPESLCALGAKRSKSALLRSR